MNVDYTAPKFGEVKDFQVLMERALMSPVDFLNHPQNTCVWKPKMTRKNTKHVREKTALEKEETTTTIEFRKTRVMRAAVKPDDVEVECGHECMPADEFPATIANECIDRNEITITRGKPRDPEIDER
jgi:hypothetical protein